MSSIFSDPGWRRGGTLLNGELVEFSDAPTNTVPSAGTELVGQVKVFQDIDPYTGVRKSNRLVYCVAARYTGSTTISRTENPLLLDAHKGKFVVLSDGLSTFDVAALADNADAVAGKVIGVLDEYLTVDVRQHDIVWVVVKGPCQVQTVAASAVGANVAVGLDAAGDTGLLDDAAIADVTAATAVQVGISLGAAASDVQRINLMSSHI